ncbi:MULTISPECIES: hypothetical protein [Sphingobacterium]|uniref:hypothetical protein n=1 Tax=Sphingobacterium TaxID=28453 RepID=UPI000DF8A3ED|nr:MULTISPECIES: hypothetical protein [Sphingobacterium]QQT47169.1 hypothetical protein I6J00_11135 [Sphingobacterium multivorum]SUJ13757.1 Uncharacterised protein [Sphingobacterium multivorum]
MRDTYFKTRRPFSRRKHRYDIGSPIGFWNYYDDNHFLTRLYVIGNEEQEQYYNYHMEYAVSTGKCTEAEFYAHVREIVADHIEAIRKESPFSRKHGRNRVNLKCLRIFRDYLISINTYGYRDPVDITITRYDMEIALLKKELAKKNKELEELKIYESEYKVKITNGYLSAFIDLMHQFPEIRIPTKDGTRLLSASTDTVWAKMICKYFQHGDKALNIETIRSRFTSDKEKPNTKYRPIRDKDKIFKIVSNED